MSLIPTGADDGADNGIGIMVWWFIALSGSVTSTASRGINNVPLLAELPSFSLQVFMLCGRTSESRHSKEGISSFLV